MCVCVWREDADDERARSGACRNMQTMRYD